MQLEPNKSITTVRLGGEYWNADNLSVHYCSVIRVTVVWSSSPESLM